MKDPVSCFLDAPDPLYASNEEALTGFVAHVRNHCLSVGMEVSAATAGSAKAGAEPGRSGRQNTFNATSKELEAAWGISFVKPFEKRAKLTNFTKCVWRLDGCGHAFTGSGQYGEEQVILSANMLTRASVQTPKREYCPRTAGYH